MLAEYAPYALSALRIAAGLVFLNHGTSKILNFPPHSPSVKTGTMEWYSGMIELICGVLIVLGLFTAPAAFIASGEMAVAYFTVHMRQNFFPVLNGGDAAILFCFVFFFLVFAGPGPVSLDAILFR